MIRDPQVLDFIAATEAAYPPETNDASAVENRRYYDAMCAVFRAPRPEGLPVSDRMIGGVPCRVYGAETPVFVLYLHGGGFVVGGLDSHDDICAELADATGLQVIAVDYRLAPEHRWRAAFDDVQAVWDALDRSGIVAGDSAGGGLAASLCLSRPARMPLAQVLIYPALGGDGSAPSYRENAEAPLLRTTDLAAYHTAAHGAGPVDPLSAPLRAYDLSGLPPALIVTADVDPLRDDGRDYTARLGAAGVAAQWRNEADLPHGYLRARRISDRARRSFQAIVAGVARMGNVVPPR
ncbi:MAG: alpha/beta hydrolase [Paracoccus sp. (in: a-proteobacteria)]|nr:alpha/beta hydrolase [Paracoccus sp. (in: a-proteobacteria)]